eukprot:COSAG01_NODE_71889_length_254_cov_1.045161_2_plen_32_part_01
MLQHAMPVSGCASVTACVLVPAPVNISVKTAA